MYSNTNKSYSPARVEDDRMKDFTTYGLLSPPREDAGDSAERREAIDELFGEWGGDDGLSGQL
jgi:hypothetical protein